MNTSFSNSTSLYFQLIYNSLSNTYINVLESETERKSVQGSWLCFFLTSAPMYQGWAHDQDQCFHPPG